MLYSCANCFAMCGRKCESAPVVVVWIAVIGIMMRNTRHIYTVYTCIISKWNKKLKAKRARAHTYTHWLFGQHESQIMKKKQKKIHSNFEKTHKTLKIDFTWHTDDFYRSNSFEILVYKLCSVCHWKRHQISIGRAFIDRTKIGLVAPYSPNVGLAFIVGANNLAAMWVQTAQWWRVNVFMIAMLIVYTRNV